MSRMAGMAVENYLGHGPDMGKVAAKQHVRDAKENISGMRSESLVGQASLGEYGATAAHGAITEAKGDYMAAQQQASNMQKAGGLLGEGIGGLGSLFGGGSGGGGGFSLANSTAGNYNFWG